MTVPNLDFLGGDSTQSNNETQVQPNAAVPDVSFLDTTNDRPQVDQSEQGVFAPLVDLGKSAFKLGVTFTRLQHPDLDPAIVNQVIKANKENGIETIKKLGTSLASGLDTITGLLNKDPFVTSRVAKDVATSYQKISDSFSEQFAATKGQGLLKTAVGLPISIGAGVVKGLVIQPVAEGINSLYGFDAYDPNTILTPEQRAQSVKSTVANIAAFAVGAKVNEFARAALYSKEFAGAESLEGFLKNSDKISNEALLSLPGATRVGALGRTIAASVLTGAGAGASYGLLDRFGEADMFSSAISDAVTFAPFGVAMDMVFGHPIKTYNEANLAREAGQNLYKLRLMQYNEEQSLAQNIGKVEDIRSADDLAEAVVRNGLKFSKNGVVIVSGVKNPLKFFMEKDRQYHVAIHADDAGGHTVLFANNDIPLTPEQKNFFADTGYLPNEVVIHEGRKYKITGTIGERAVIQGKYGEEPIYPKWDEIRRTGDVEIEEPSSVSAAEFAGIRNINDRERVATYKVANGDEVYVQHSVDPNGRLNIGFIGSTGGERSVGASIRGVFRDLVRRTDATDIAGERISGARPSRIVERNAGDYYKTRKLDVKTTSTADYFNNLYNRFKTYYDGNGDRPFDEVLRTFVDQNNIDERHISTLARDFGQRIFDEYMAANDPHDAMLYSEMQTKLDDWTREDSQQKSKQARSSASRAFDSALANNMRLEFTPGNGYRLRDLDSHNLLGQFTDIDAVQKFLNESGQASAAKMDDAGGIPTDHVKLPPSGGELPPNVKENWEPGGPGFSERIANWFHSVTPFLTPFSEWAKSMDNLYGTSIHARVYQTTQDAFRKVAPLIDHYRKDIVPLLKALRGSSMERRELIGQAIETMSADEIKRAFSVHRGLTPYEEAEAKWLAENNIDLRKVFDYRAAMRGISDAIPATISENGVEKPNPTFLEAQEQLQKRMNMDQNHVIAADKFDKISKMPMDKASIYGVYRYADALQKGPEGALSRADFFKKHKFTETEKFIVSQIENMYKLLAPVFGVEDVQMLRGYMNHYRDFQEFQPLGHAWPEEEFLSQLHRTGEINDFVRDPIQALERYIVRGFKSNEGFYKAISDAQNALGDELQSIRAQRGNGAYLEARKIADRYLSDVTGRRPTERMMAQSNLEQALKDFNSRFLKIGPKTSENIIGAILTVSETAAQGLRPMAGIRDYFQFVTHYATRFGFVRAGRAVMAMHSDKIVDSLIEAGIIPNGTETGKGVRQMLEEKGISPALNTRYLIDPASSTTGYSFKARSALQTMGDIGLKGSLQDRAYQRAHAGAYMESWHHTAQLLRDLSEGKIDKAKAYDKIGLDQYDQSVQKEFDARVSRGDFAGASDYLARVTGAETVFLYGAANHPTYWNTNFGRLLGQFGMWSTYELRFMTRMLTRGSKMARAARVARLATMYGALHMIGRATGLNFDSWYSTPSSLWQRGGAFFNLVGTAIGATSSMDFERNKNLKVLSRFNPLNNTGQIYLPFSYAISDWMKAADLWNRDFNPIPVVAQGLGFKVDRTQTSWADELMGSSPHLGYGGGRPKNDNPTGF